MKVLTFPDFGTNYYTDNMIAAIDDNKILGDRTGKIIEVIENYTSEKQRALSQLELLVNNYSIESVSENFVKLYRSLI